MDKIHSQCIGLAENGYRGNLFIVKNSGFGYYIVDKGTCKLKKTIPFAHKRKSLERNIFDEFSIFLQFVKEIKKLIEEEVVDFVYIRQIIPITPMLINLVKYIKRKKIKILYEYPTYPWKIDMKYITNNFFYYMDCLQYESLIKHVDNVVCYGKYDGINSKFKDSMNGINVKKYPLGKISHVFEQKINLLAVANVLEVHGYDRIIRGLRNYYSSPQKIDVIFHIVGNVNARLGLQEMVEKYELTKKVVFHGYTTGKKLDELYQLADIGVDTLAYYRRGENCIAGSLKSREYLARGIPFIFSGNLDIMMNQKEKDFIIRVPILPDTICIDQLLEKIYSIETCPEMIRLYAKENLNWEKIMGKILTDCNLEVGDK